MKKTIFHALFFILILTGSNAFGQKYLMLRNRFGEKHEVIQVGKKVKIITDFKEKTKGRLSIIKDSSIVIENAKGVCELEFKNMHYICVKQKNGWKTTMGTIGAIMSVELTSFFVSFLGSTTSNNNASGTVNDSPAGVVLFFTGMTLPAFYSLTYFGLIHKTKYDLRYRYDLKVVEM